MGGNSFDGEDLPSISGPRSDFRGSSADAGISTIGSVTHVIHDAGGTKTIGQVNVLIRVPNGSTKEITAYPLSPHSFTCPLPNEKVHCIQDTDSTQWYYTGLCSNGWRINHLSTAQILQYKTGKEDVYYGEWFIPKLDRARAVNVYEGDVIMQSRNGASLRFSYSNANIETPWKVSADGDQTAMVCLRTGVLPTEKLSHDFASLWLTTNQNIELPLQSALPQEIENQKNSYKLGQAILYSDRIVIGSRSDDILLSSKKTIQLSTQKYQHDVDKVLDLMGEILTELKKLSKEVKSQAQYSMTQTFPVPSLGTSLPSTQATNYGRSFNAGIQIEQTLMQIEQKFDMLKQK
mgnify:CR=1 FL=1|tara:strand:+ start:527 stop:1570 length:1044 start_codon:yes stop_codon:yes gene_type:complete